MSSIQNRISKVLEEREANNALRSLSVNTNLIDFCSNDYLGIAHELKLSDSDAGGSTGSRLITGNTKEAEELEQFLAAYHNAEAGLLYNSGYDANIGLFSSVPQRGDIILYDELAHASIRDGIRLSNAKSYSFAHNSLKDLKKRLDRIELQEGKEVFVAIESIYSMDGDSCPLKEISDLCGQYNANLIIDEAHSTGWVGDGGKGMVFDLDLEDKIFARLHTFGKAMGCHGAVVFGSQKLREFLINYSRSFIYTTALPVHSLKAIKAAYFFVLLESNKILEIRSLITLFKDKIKELIDCQVINSDSPIQCLIIPGNDRVKELASQVQKAGFDVRPILSPTVPKGSERIRICLHAFNTEKQVEDLVKTIKNNL